MGEEGRLKGERETQSGEAKKDTEGRIEMLAFKPSLLSLDKNFSQTYVAYLFLVELTCL